MYRKTLFTVFTISICFGLVFSWAGLTPNGTAQAEVGEINASNKDVYTDQVGKGWNDFSWGTVDLSNPSPVHGGASSIKVDLGDYTGLYLYYPGLFPDGFNSVKLFIHGGASGGQQLDLYLKFFDGVNYVEGTRFIIPAPQINLWQEVTVPFSSLGVSDLPITGIVIQNRTAGVLPTFYVDDIS